LWPTVEPYLVRFTYLLHDLSKISNDELRDGAMRTALANEHVGPEALQALLERDLGPEAKDAIMTAGQQIFEQGRLKGRQQGVQELLLRFLRQRFGEAVDAHVEQRIATASIEQIEAWSARVLSAATLAEAIAD
jgi:hypothetical protein